MALTIGKVSVDFIANIETLLKAIDKVAAKVESLTKLDNQITVKLDDNAMKQLDRITKSVENLSDLGNKFKEVVVDVFDLMDGKIGNVSKQIKNDLGGSVKDVGDQVDDGITKFFSKVTDGLKAMSPLLLGQVLGAGILIEKLVKGGFQLKAILPAIFQDTRSGLGLATQFINLFKSFSFGTLLSFVTNLSQGLLSITTVVAILTTGLRALTGLTLNFLQRRPETTLQKFVLLLETLNAGFNDLLARSRIIIERMFFVASLLGSVSAILVGIKLGVTALTGTVAPWLSLVFVGLTGIRLAAVKIQDMLLRFRAAAGDGRAQTTLFLRAIRQLFPLFEALAKNAKPLAKMLNEFAKGGIDKRIKAVIGSINEGISSLKRIDATMRDLLKLIDSMLDKVLSSLNKVIDKADQLFQTIGRQGARDAIASVERVRSTAVRATKDVSKELQKLAPATVPVRKSLTEIGSSFFDFSRRAMNIATRGAIGAAGGVLSLMLFGKSGNVIPLLNPLNLLRDRATSSFDAVGQQAREAGEEVSNALSPKNIGAALASFSATAGQLFTVLIEKASTLGSIFWSTVTNKTTIVAAFKAASITLGTIAPLLAVSLGVILTPLLLRAARNLTVGVAKIAGETWREAWPTLRSRILVPIGDLITFIPRQIKSVVTDKIPAAVNIGIAKVAKGTMSLRNRVKEFFGVIPISTEKATKKAADILAKQLEPAVRIRKELAQTESIIERTRTALVRAQDAVRAQGRTIEKDHPLMQALRRGLARRDALVADLRDIGSFVGDVFSDEVRSKLVDKIKEGKRPIRKEIYDTGTETARALASGITAASQLIGAALIAPFSRARTVTLLRSGVANLAKSVQSSLSLALRTAGNSVQILIAGLERIPDAVSFGIKVFKGFGPAATAVAGKFSDLLKVGVNAAKGIGAEFKKFVSDPGASLARWAEASYDAFASIGKAVLPAGKAIGKFAADTGKKFLDLFSSGGKTRRTIGGFFKGIAAEGAAVAKSFQRNLGAGFIRSLLSPFSLLARGLRGLGNLLGGRGGLTAGTAQERAAAGRDAAAAEKQKTAADLLALQKAEKAAREAQLLLTKKATDAEKDKILQAEATVAASIENNIAVAELYNTWTTLRTEADKLRDEFKNTATVAGRIDERFEELAGSDFDAFVELSKKITSVVAPVETTKEVFAGINAKGKAFTERVATTVSLFDKVRSDLKKFADSFGLSADKQEKIFDEVAKAEEKLKAEVAKYSTALDDITVETASGVKTFKDVFQEWSALSAASKSARERLDQGTAGLEDLRTQFADIFPEGMGAAIENLQAGFTGLADNVTKSDLSFLSPEQTTRFKALYEEVENLTFAMSVQQGIIDSSLTTAKQKEAAEEKLAELMEQKAAAQAEENALDAEAAKARQLENKLLRSQIDEAQAFITEHKRLADGNSDLLKAIEQQEAAYAVAMQNVAELSKAQEAAASAAMLVEKGMATQRGNMLRLNNVLANYTSEIEKATAGVEGVNRLSDVAKIEASGKEASFLKNQEVAQAKALLAADKEETAAAKAAVVAYEALIKEKGTLKEAVKADAKATKKLTESDDVLSAVGGEVTAAQEQAKTSVAEVAAAMQTQADVIEQKTRPALEKVAEGGNKLAAAMIRAEESVHVAEKAMRKVADKSEQQATEKSSEDAAQGKARARKSGPAVSKDELQQVKDIFGLLLKAETPLGILNANLSKIRESLKNHPIFKVVNEMQEIGSASELAFAIMERVSHEPEKVINSLNDGMKQLVALLVQMEESTDKKSAFLEQFNPALVKHVIQTERVLRQLQTLESKFRPGGGQKRSDVPEFGRNVTKALAASIAEAAEQGGNFDEVAARVIATVQEKLGASVQGMRLTEANEIFVQRINDMLLVAADEIDATGKGMADKGLRLISGLADGVTDGGPLLEKAMDKQLNRIKDSLPGSLPKRGPLLKGILGMAKLGETMAQQMMKGKAGLAKATDELLKPIADRLEHHSPPSIGKLGIAERSIVFMGQTIGQQMMLGVGALKNAASQFLQTGFAGFAAEAFSIGQRGMKSLSDGIGAASKAIVRVLDKIPVLGLIAAIPIKIASGLSRALLLVGSGIAGLAASITGKLGALLTETAGKLRQLGLQAKRLDLEPDRLQRFNEAMGLLGAQSGDAENALQQLRQSIDQVISGQAPELATTFAKAGLSLQDLKRLKPDEIFLRIAEAANAAGDDIKTQQELLRIVGADFSNLRGVVLQGSEALAEAFEKANKNPPISAEAMERARKLQTFLTVFEQTVERIKIIIFEEISPAVEELMGPMLEQGADGVSVILENVRAVIRIVVRSITEIAKFIRDRYINAQNGLDNLLEDATGAISILSELAWSAVKSIGSALPGLFSSVMSVLWSMLGSKGKVLLAEAWNGIVHWFSKIGAYAISVAVGLFKSLGTTIGDFFSGALGAQIEIMGATIVKKIREWFGDTIADMLGIDSVEAIDQHISEVEADMDRRRAVSDTKTYSSVWAEVARNADKAVAEIEKSNEAANDLSRKKIALEEVAAVFRHFSSTAKDSADRITLLRDVVQRFSQDSLDTLDALGEGQSIKKLEETISGLAQRGFIKPGDLTQATEILRKEAAEAFSKVQGDLFAALKTAFDKGFARTKKELPEIAELLEKIGVISEEEFADVARRVAELAAAGKATKENIEKILNGTDRLKSSTAAVARAMDDLRKSATSFLDEFSGKMGIALPALQRNADAVTDSFVVMQEELVNLAAQNPKVLGEMAKRLGIQEATVSAIVEELKRREAISAEIAKQKRLLEQMQKGLSLRQQLEDLAAGTRGPFAEAARQVDNLKVQMKQALLDLREQFQQLSSGEIITFANGLGISTNVAASSFQRLTAATLALHEALALLASAKTPEQKRQAEERVKAAQDEFQKAQENADKAMGDLKEGISKNVEEGFSAGMGAAAGRPWANMLNDNLFQPVFAGFKDTIKGLVDGSLMEAARAAEESAEMYGQKFSRALFVVADFGKKIFEAAFDKLLDQTFTLLTETLTKSITESFASDAAEGAAGNLGDVAGSAIGAAITAAIALGGLLLSRLQSEIKATKEAVDDIVQSSEAIRGVISGSTTVAIKEAEDAFRDAQRPITVRLDTIIGLMRSALGGANIPSIPLGAAGSTTLGP